MQQLLPGWRNLRSAERGVRASSVRGSDNTHHPDMRGKPFACEIVVENGTLKCILQVSGWFVFDAVVIRDAMYALAVPSREPCRPPTSHGRLEYSEI
jgi:hypothetical protein